MDPAIPQLVTFLLRKHALHASHASNSSVEIEARLRGEIVTNSSVNKLLAYPCDWTETKYLEKRKISKTSRKCTYRHREVYSPDNASETICKSSLAKDELYNLWCTIHVSTEINAPTMLSSLEDITADDITRMRATLQNHWVDVTYDSMGRARVEIEVPDSSAFDPQGLLCAVSFVCSILQDSVPVMVDKLDWITIKTLVDQPFGAFCVSTKSYQKPITMVKHDVMKVLSGNNWLATPKADGVRCMVYILEGIVLSVDLAGSVRHVYYISTDNPGISVLDCEYLKAREGNATYHVIDIPVHNDKYIGNTPTIKRLQIAQDLVNFMRTKEPQIAPFAIVMKPYAVFSSFLELEKLYASWHKKYTIDGIIFADKNQGYLQRVLKWKAVNTIDLEVAQDTDGTTVLQTCDGYTLDTSVTIENIEKLSACASLDASSRQIWEFEYIKGCLLPIRHRPDKPRANSLGIVQKNTDPLLLPSGLFTGVECFLMRKYHNKEKARLLSNSHTDRAVIMDIGTGQGGDLTKWGNATEVYCIEPDQHALKELRNRIKDSKPKFKVKIIEFMVKTLQLTKITNKISIFTAFFCMNLWQEDDWSKLELAIKDKGSRRCRFIAIALTHPVQGSNRCWKLKLTSDSTYKLSIHGTRITRICESVVDIQKLNDVMKRCGLHVVVQHRLNNRKEMTSLENSLSNMYTALVYVRKPQIVK